MRQFSWTASALPVAGALCAILSACGPGYSPDTYASNAAQQAARVDQGVVVGVRAVKISADATIGTTTGAAAGGIVGSQVGGGAGGALGALGGTVAGGTVGNVVAHAAGDTDGYEYIVRKGNGDLVSVTQKDISPLEIGAHVLVIQGPQARVVLDYTVPMPPVQAASIQAKPGGAPPSVAPPAETGSSATAIAPATPIVATPLPAPAPVQPITPAAPEQPAPPVVSGAPVISPAPAPDAKPGTPEQARGI
jgi:outer membrane lipoprotein SlyB